MSFCFGADASYLCGLRSRCSGSRPIPSGTIRESDVYSAALASTTRKTDSSPVTLALPMTTF
jgi:hypothetical protein